jgi:outer membrane protein OmpA-like peptidoglycan-associated protein
MRIFFLFFALFSFVHADYTFSVSPLPGKINTDMQEFGPSLTADGNTLYFYSKRGSNFTDIYMSKKVNGQWATPTAVKALNSPYDDQSPYISPEGKFLIFSSNRDGSIEFQLPDGRIGVSRDIYYSELRDGKWITPVALPGQINTNQIEENPFLQGDFFYFTRYPFAKPEQAQIYSVKLVNDSFTNEKPVLLPYPINMPPFATIAFIVSKDGKEVYFSSNRPGGYGGFDIYKAKVLEKGYSEPENLGPEINSIGDEAFLLLDETDKNILFCRKEQGKSYDIYSAREVKKDDLGEILKIKKKLTLNTINFDVNKSEIKPESFAELDKIVSYLNDNPDLKIKIIGHTDLTGEKEHNENLSKERAESVKKYFIKKGLNSEAILTEGKGSNEPLFQELSPENNKKNRRTEFVIIE